MSLRDSLLVIAHRERFPDLAAALALIGVALDSAAAPVAWRDAPATEAISPFTDEAEASLPQAAAADGWSADDIRRAEDPAAAFEHQERPEESQAEESQAEENPAEDTRTEDDPVTGTHADGPAEDQEAVAETAETGSPAEGNDTGQQQADSGNRKRADGDARPREDSAKAASVPKPRALPASRPADKPPGVIAGIIDADFQVTATAVTGPGTSAAYVSIPKSQSAGAAARSPADTAFNVRTLSSALHGLVRVEREGAEPNIDAAVARIAAGEPLSRVPTTPRRGPPGRICVLCDLNLRSGPYREDVRYMIQVARRLFSDGSLEFLTFKGTPARGCGTGPIWTWAPYADLPAFDITMIIGCGTANRDGGPHELHSFAMQLIAAEREVCVVLIGAEPGAPKTRPYPQLLVRD